MKVRDIVQEVGIKTIPKKKKCKKAKWVNEEALQIAVKKRKVKGKGENERGQRQTEFCQENALVIANTIFQQHKRRLYTWTSPDGQY